MKCDNIYLHMLGEVQFLLSERFIVSENLSTLILVRVAQGRIHRQPIVYVVMVDAM